MKNEVNQSEDDLERITTQTPALESQEDVQLGHLSFWQIFKMITLLGLAMGVSFTFSQVVFLSDLFMNLQDESDTVDAASGLIAVFVNMLILFMGFLPSQSIVMSRELGALDTLDKANNNANQIAAIQERVASAHVYGLLMSGTLAIFPTLMLKFAGPILMNLGQEKEVAQVVQNFGGIYCWAAVLQMLRMSIEQTIFSFKKNTYAMGIGIGSMFVAVPIASLLGFGWDKLGVAPMGAAGFALGFSSEALLTCIGFSLVVKFGKAFQEYEFFSVKKFLARLKSHPELFKEMLKIGSGISFTMGIELALNFCITIFSGWLGTDPQAAIGIVLDISFFSFVFMAALSATGTQLLSRELGAKNATNAHNIAKYSLLPPVVVLGPFLLTAIIYPKILEHMVNGVSPEVSAILPFLTRVMGIGFFLDWLRYGVVNHLRALGDFHWPNLISIISVGSGIGMAYGLGIKTSLGINGIAIAYTLTQCLALAGLGRRWFNQIKIPALEEKILEKEQAELAAKESPAQLVSSTQTQGFSFKKAFSQGSLLVFSYCPKRSPDNQNLVVEATPLLLRAEPEGQFSNLKNFFSNCCPRLQLQSLN